MVFHRGVSHFNYLAHSFSENGYQRWAAVTVEYATLLQEHVQDLLALEETRQCIQRHLQADILLPSLRKNKKTETTEHVPQNGLLSQQTDQQVVLDLVVPLIECCRQGSDQDADLLASLRATDGQLGPPEIFTT